MRKLIVEEWLSLDGFATDKEGKLDFFAHLTPEQNKYSHQDQLQSLKTNDTPAMTAYGKGFPKAS